MEAGAVVSAMLIFLCGAAAVVLLISLWRIFTKARMPGWTAVVPFCNVIVLLEIVERPWWWIFLFMIPVVGLVFIVHVIHRLSLSFGWGTGMTLLLIFLPFIGYPILAFGGSRYRRLGGKQGDN